MLIALIRTQIFDFEVEKNLNNLTDICNNLSNTIDWVIFPEMFISGFVMDTSLCEISKTRGLDFMHKLAINKSCSVEGSLLIAENNTIPRKNTIYRNRHYLISQNKEWYYDKQKLFSLSNEAKVLTAGEESTIAKVNEWNVNLKTCYDLRFADICKNGIQYSKDNKQCPLFNYDIMTFVASWPWGRSEQWETLLKARAIENQCYIIGVNRYGKDSMNLDYGGECYVIDMKGNILTPLSQSTQNILYYNIEKKDLDEGRHKFPVYLDW